MKELDITVLVNKDNPLDSKYVPLKMYVVDKNENNFHKYKDASLKPMLRQDIKKYIDKLLRDAHSLGLPLIVDSGYRSYNYQQVVLNALIKEKGDEAYKLVALPGTSEHQTGLSLDIFSKLNNNKLTFKDTETAKWLENNAYRFGFILRYPKDKVKVTGYSYEAWHFRYVGKEIAKYVYENNITFEEYYAYFIEK